MAPPGDNFDKISECRPNFRFLTKFQNLDQISESRPNYRLQVVQNTPCVRVFQLSRIRNENIARGTTDPGYYLFNLSYLSSLKLALVPILITRWRNLHWLQNCPPDGATCISSKLDHQVESLASVAKLSTRWRHLHELQWPPIGATCISCKFGHQMAPLEMVTFSV